MIYKWLIAQKLFLGSGTEKILYMSSERTLKMLSFEGHWSNKTFFDISPLFEKSP